MQCDAIQTPGNTPDFISDTVSSSQSAADNEPATTIVEVTTLVDNNDSSTSLEPTTIPTETPTTTSELPIAESANASVELKSEGFPNPFPALYNQVWK